MVRSIFIALLVSPLLMGLKMESSFDNNLFLKNGPYQQGSVILDRTKLQAVVTWCSPTLLQMRVYENVKKEIPTNYSLLKGENHPLQVSLTVFPPELPFKYSENYGSPTLATSTCSPAKIQTTLSTVSSISSDLSYESDKSFEVKSNKPEAVAIDCSTGKSGMLANWQYSKSLIGKTGGFALIPAGETTIVSAECQLNGFFIKMR